MIDPLAVIFLPGGAVAALALFVGPLVVLRHHLWRRKARQLNARRCCARCGDELEIDELYLYFGTYVCAQCAPALRRRLTIVIPMTLLAATVFGVSSAAAFFASMRSGGPELAWWLDGRWIPLLLPSVGVATLTGTIVTLGKRANRLRNAAVWREVDPGDAKRWHLFPGA